VLTYIAGYSLVSILLGLLYLKTQNIWLAVGFHLFWNYTQGIFKSFEDLPSIYLFESVCIVIILISVVFFIKKYKII
jgi:membrane protease YdiL (CAAX protease family)